MLRPLLLSTLASAVLFAQEPEPAAATAPLQQARERLQKCLVTTAALDTCAFAVEWGAADKVGRRDATADEEKGAEVANLLMFGGPTAGTAEGTWTQSALHAVLGDDELLLVGRRMLARDANAGWAARTGRFADGNRIPFLPDPARLVRALSVMDLDVVHRQVATLDDKPIEILSVELDRDQTAALAWDGLLPEQTGFDGLTRVLVGRMPFGGRGGRAALPPPARTVDLAIHIDPGTGLVHKVHVRTWRTGNGVAVGGNLVFVGGGGARGQINVRGGNVTDDADEDDEDNEPVAGPMQFEDGLPRRSRKKTSVEDCVFELRQHGEARLPEFDGAARELLRGR